MKIEGERIDVTIMTDKELMELARYGKELYDGAWRELNRWETIRCTVCEREDLSYRSEPFITWTHPSGYMLCPTCSFKFDRKSVMSPIDEILELID